MRLTVGGHPHGDALLEATFLALVPGHLVNCTLALVLAGVGGVEVLLDGPSEEPLRRRGGVVVRTGPEGAGSARTHTHTHAVLPCSLRR